MTERELKPCKCGGYPYHRRDTRNGVTGRHFECKDCGFFHWWPSTEEAIAAWNRRAGMAITPIDAR